MNELLNNGSSEGIGLEIVDQIAILTIFRPKTANSLDWAAQARFAKLIMAVNKSKTIRVLIITAQGNLFVSGGDIKNQADHFDQATALRLQATMGAALQQLTEMDKPVIAAINGNAYGGGCEIITACDLRIMAASAKLQFVHTRMGLVTGWGGTARLKHLIGASHAMHCLLASEPINAETALAWGLVNQVVSIEEDVLKVAIEMAQKLCGLSAESLAAFKQLVWDGVDLDGGYATEAKHFRRLWGQSDHRKAVHTFLQKGKGAK